MLRIAIYWLVLTEDAIEDAGGLLVIHLSLLAEVDAADPFVLDLLEGRLHLHDHCQLVEEVPEGLELAVDVGVLGGLADVAQALDLPVGLLQLLPLLALAVHLPLLLGCFWVGLLRRHCITPKISMSDL